MDSGSRRRIGVIVAAGWALLYLPVWADVPMEPSEVWIQGTQLIVRKRQPDGSLDSPKPYIIEGVTWAPSTRAPATGANPLDPHGTDPAIPERDETNNTRCTASPIQVM